MVFNGEESLHIAQFLGGQVISPYPVEASQRAIVSRAYFAAFGHALHYEIDNGRFKSYGKSDDHARLRIHLAKTRKEVIIASELEDLRRWRNQCDYHKNVIGILSQYVTDALKNANHIIQHLK